MSSPTIPAAPAHALPAATSVGAVHLSVADLARSIAYYETQVGLRVLDREATSAALGVVGRELLVLHEQPGAVLAPRSAGLFHFALLLPERTDLARWLLHAIHDRVALSGLSDHYVSEAIYLNDPDGHGIEIYADSPRAIWEGQVAERLSVDLLDSDDLIASLDGETARAYGGMPVGTRMGHVHLRVSDLRASTSFYRDVLGFAEMGTLGASAAFFGAGGYHHHVGVNTWHSAGARTARSGTATLIKVTLVVPNRTTLEDIATRTSAAGFSGESTTTGIIVRDPSEIAIDLTITPESSLS